MREKSAIRRALPILVAAVLLTAIFVDVRASYPAAGGTVTISVPNAMKNFPAELLPQ
jgi:hypothetical protein